jgi:SAM-dependent methyltransferase
MPLKIRMDRRKLAIGASRAPLADRCHDRRMEGAQERGARLRHLFDKLGEGEWDRLEKDPRSRVALEIHRRFLRRHVPRGSRVLEIGAGAGRFTIELAQLACDVVVSDISPVQLSVNEQHVIAAGVESAVVERRVLDVCDLSSVPEDSFDAVVAYGGPLSYAFDDAEHSFSEVLRVVRPGGNVLASVMDSIGTLRLFVSAVPLFAGQGRLGILERVMATGDNRLDESGHPCRMFRWREIEAMIDRLACRLRDASSSNFLSSGDQQVLAEIEQDAAQWKLLLDWEEEYCREPGALDSGTHLLFAVQRPVD